MLTIGCSLASTASASEFLSLVTQLRSYSAIKRDAQKGAGERTGDSDLEKKIITRSRHSEAFVRKRPTDVAEGPSSFSFTYNPSSLYLVAATEKVRVIAEKREQMARSAVSRSYGLLHHLGADGQTSERAGRGETCLPPQNITATERISVEDANYCREAKRKGGVSNPPSVPQHQKSKFFLRTIEEEMAPSSPLSRIAEGSLDHTAARRMTAHERAVVSERLNSLHSIASITGVSPSTVIEHTRDVVRDIMERREPSLSSRPSSSAALSPRDRVRSEKRSGGEEYAALLVKAGKSLGEYIRWVAHSGYGNAVSSVLDSSRAEKGGHAVRGLTAAGALAKTPSHFGPRQPYFSPRSSSSASGSHHLPSLVSAGVGVQWQHTESAADIIFGSILILRSAAYTAACRAVHLSSSSGVGMGAVEGGPHEAVVRMLLDSIAKAVWTATCPLPPSMLSFLSRSTRDCGGLHNPQSSRGKLKRQVPPRSQWSRLKSHLMSGRAHPLTPELSSWLISVERLLYSLEEGGREKGLFAHRIEEEHHGHEEEDATGRMCGGTVQPDDVVRILSARCDSTLFFLGISGADTGLVHHHHHHRHCGVKNRRGASSFSHFPPSLLSDVDCVSVIRSACEVDTVFHSREWVLVSDTYTALLERREAVRSTGPNAYELSPPSVSAALFLEVSPAVGGRSPIVMGVPPSLHTRCYATMARFAPLAHCLAIKRLTEEEYRMPASHACRRTSHTSHFSLAYEDTKQRQTVDEALRGHLALAAVSSRLPIKSLISLGQLDEDRDTVQKNGAGQSVSHLMDHY